MRDEFKRHKSAEAYYVGVFMKEWNLYHDDLAKQVAAGEWKKLGKTLKEETLDQLSEPQAGQLYELMQAAKQPKNI